MDDARFEQIVAKFPALRTLRNRLAYDVAADLSADARMVVDAGTDDRSGTMLSHREEGGGDRAGRDGSDQEFNGVAADRLVSTIELDPVSSVYC